MTYTKRQWFLYRVKQCLNLLWKVNTYMNDVDTYVKNSTYKKRISKIHKEINKCWLKLDKFLDEVK